MTGIYWLVFETLVAAKITRQSKPYHNSHPAKCLYCEKSYSLLLNSCNTVILSRRYSNVNI